MAKYEITIAKEFSEVLGGRWERLGPYSGELFYNKILENRFESAQADNEKLHVYLDGTKGYGSSFLDQSFGELARKFGIEEVKKGIEFHTIYFSWIVDYIKENIWVSK